MKFYKMEGLGNDYIYINCFEERVDDPASLAVRLSDRHFSVGGDGVILLCPSEKADIRMRMFNADGSEGKMCGNGIRCLSKLARDLGIVTKDTCTVETLSGIKSVELFRTPDGQVASARVDMGAPVLKGEDIPSTMGGERTVDVPAEIGGRTYRITLVSMGNPHCVVFEDPDKTDMEKTGPLFENSPYFPERINTEFVRTDGENELTMRVWERGSGETMACGTGACAAAVASVLCGYCRKGEPIRVHLLGGDLTVTYTDEAVYMEGPARLVFTGETDCM